MGRRVPAELALVVPGGQQSTVNQRDGTDGHIAVGEGGPCLAQRQGHGGIVIEGR
jgi:hypothetical protein